jgi:hypothetical protein
MVEVLAMSVNCCQHCGKEMVGRANQARYCSLRCRNDAAIEKRRQRIKAKRDAHPSLKWGWCVHCEKRFPLTRRDRQYCSSACRQADWRRMKFWNKILF